MIRTNQVESIKYLKFLIDCKGQQNRDPSAGVEEGVLRKRTYFEPPRSTYNNSKCPVDDVQTILSFDTRWHSQMTSINKG